MNRNVVNEFCCNVTLKHDAVYTLLGSNVNSAPPPLFAIYTPRV
jgi:hypothetical protein